MYGHRARVGHDELPVHILSMRTFSVCERGVCTRRHGPRHRPTIPRRIFCPCRCTGLRVSARLLRTRYRQSRTRTRPCIAYGFRQHQNDFNYDANNTLHHQINYGVSVARRRLCRGGTVRKRPSVPCLPRTVSVYVNRPLNVDIHANTGLARTKQAGM